MENNENKEIEKIDELIKPYSERLQTLTKNDLKVLALDAFQEGMNTARKIFVG